MRKWICGLCISMMGVVGCGGGFLAMTDYQRDLFGMLAVWVLTRNNNNLPQQGEQGQSGLACWDRNENFVADLPDEDLNLDGYVDVFDCHGTNGSDGQDGENGVNGQNGLDGQDGSDGSNGSDGLSCWDLNGDGEQDCLSEACYYKDQYPAKTRISVMMQEQEPLNEDVNNDGYVDVRDCAGQPGQDGEDGEPGAGCSVDQNEDGSFTVSCEDGSSATFPPPDVILENEFDQLPIFFDVFVEDFWRHGTGENGFEVGEVDIKEPELKNNSSVAFRVNVPQQFNLNTDAHVSLRLFILKRDGLGNCEEQISKTILTNGSWWNNQGNDDDEEDPDCFQFNLIGKRLQDGTDVQNWGPERLITVNAACQSDGLVTVDLPLSVSCEDGLGWPSVSPGDFLAFELSAECINRGEYVLLGAELFSYNTYELTNATVSCNED